MTRAQSVRRRKRHAAFRRMARTHAFYAYLTSFYRTMRDPNPRVARQRPSTPEPPHA